MKTQKRWPLRGVGAVSMFGTRGSPFSEKVNEPIYYLVLTDNLTFGT